MIISMKKTIITLALVLGISLSLFAQREIPMFFDRDMGLQSNNREFPDDFAVAYSPDGSKIATALYFEKIVIWDAASGKEIARLAGHDGKSIRKIIFSPNGRQVATIAFSFADSTIKIWDTISGALIRSIPQPNMEAITFSPDGNRIAGAYSGSGNRGIKIWNTANGSEIRLLTGHTDTINSVAYSPNGSQILTASDDGTVRIWDTGNGQNIRTIKGELPFMNAVYSPNERFIAAYAEGNEDVCAIHIYNTATGQKLRSIPAPLLYYDLAYSPDGRQLLVNWYIDHGSTIKVLDPETGRELRNFNNGGIAASFSPDGRKILTASAGLQFKIGDTYYGTSYAGILDATTGRTIGTIGYGPLNVGAKAFADLQIARFLGDTAAVGRHEAVLKFITDRKYATRQEIEAFYRNSDIRAMIAKVVDEEFNKIYFMLNTDTDSCNAVLVRRENQYTLTCDGYWGMPKKKEIRVFSGSSLDDLIKKMQESKNFKEQSYTYLRAQTALIPAVVYANWKAKGVASGVDGMALIKETITNFYLNPNSNTYNILRGIYSRYFIMTIVEKDSFASIASSSYVSVLYDLNAGLSHKVVSENRSEMASALNSDNRYRIFSTPYR
jgi:WD40 repeat protein